MPETCTKLKHVFIYLIFAFPFPLSLQAPLLCLVAADTLDSELDYQIKWVGLVPKMRVIFR